MQLQLDSSMLTRWSCRHYMVVQKVHELFSPIRDLALLILRKWKASRIWVLVFLGIVWGLIVYFPTRLHHQRLPDDSESVCWNSRLTLIVCRCEGTCRSLEQLLLVWCLASGPIMEDSIRRPSLTMAGSFEKWVWSDLKPWDFQSNLASWVIWLCLVSTAAQNSSPNGGIAGAGWGFLSILHHNLPKYRLMDWADRATFQ